MKFFFLHGKRSKAIHGEPTEVFGEADFRLATVKRSGRHFNRGKFSLDDESRPGRLQSEIGEAVSQFLRKGSFFSVCVLVKRLAASPHTIKEILTRDLGM
jgi:hypothetical protein